MVNARKVALTQDSKDERRIPAGQIGRDIDH
jgi:hypothetical protein